MRLMLTLCCRLPLCVTAAAATRCRHAAAAMRLMLLMLRLRAAAFMLIRADIYGAAAAERCQI